LALVEDVTAVILEINSYGIILYSLRRFSSSGGTSIGGVEPTKSSLEDG